MEIILAKRPWHEFEIIIQPFRVEIILLEGHCIGQQ